MKEEFNLMDRQVENCDENKDTDDEVITEQGVLDSSCADYKDNFIHKLQPLLRNAENAAINTLQMKMSPINDINYAISLPRVVQLSTANLTDEHIKKHVKPNGDPYDGDIDGLVDYLAFDLEGHIELYDQLAQLVSASGYYGKEFIHIQRVSFELKDYYFVLCSIIDD